MSDTLAVLPLLLVPLRHSSKADRRMAMDTLNKNNNNNNNNNNNFDTATTTANNNSNNTNKSNK